MTHFRITSKRAAALALAGILVSVAACGGFTAVDIGGTISGLTASGLVLANGSDTVSPAPNATTFVFPTQVPIRSPYTVTIAAQPARQQCQIFNNTGIAGAAPVTIVALVCSTNTYTIGGHVLGLTGTGLVLTNGSDQVTIASDNGTGNTPFTFPTPVTDLLPYGVAVLTQPNNGQNCTVSNGTNTLNGAAVTSVLVTCK